MNPNQDPTETFVVNGESVFGEIDRDTPVQMTHEHAQHASLPEVVRARLKAYLSKEEIEKGVLSSTPLTASKEGEEPMHELTFSYVRQESGKPGATFLGYVSAHEVEKAKEEWQGRIEAWLRDW